MPVEILHSIGRFRISEELSRGPFYTLYSGYDRQTSKKIVLKQYIRDALPLSEIKDILEMHAGLKLLRPGHIAQAVDMIKSPGHSGGLPAFIYEDSWGVCLKDYLCSHKPTVRDFLAIAISLASCINSFHEAGITRKGICIGFIFIEPLSASITVHDFGFPEAADFYDPLVIENILPYVSPEQTGRMNREADYRSDLYSLGIILYELLLGTPPFTAKDPAEIIHAHIARKPLPPAQLMDYIPAAVSGIIMKLLEKSPEDRYQSAWGLKRDLERASRLLDTEDEIEPFVLGTRDPGEQLCFSDRIYGRQTEIDSLLSCLEEVLRGASKITLVSGYSGIGKSSLTGSIRIPSQAAGCAFLSGKFDQYRRNMPYSALIQAFTGMAGVILGKDTETIESWRGSLLKALGANARLILDVIPEIGLITGPQPAVVELPPQEAQNRFHLAFTQFVKAIATPEHPLVLCLDDLQWADPSSLKLLESIVSSPDISHLYILGTYRSNEPAHDHPLVPMIRSIADQGVRVREINLGPISGHDVEMLAADALGEDPSSVSELSRSVYEKTQGNPFFARQFLLSLHAEKILAYDYGKGSWKWDGGLITSKENTENVVELISGKLRKLSPHTRQTLEHAACLGSSFEVQALCAETGIHEHIVIHSLINAEDEGLIASVGQSRRHLKELLAKPADKPMEHAGDIRMEFVHDRVRQTVYSRMPESRKSLLHQAIGNYLTSCCPDYSGTDKIFDVLSHLNSCREYLQTTQERDELARLNLIAGRRAKASTAYGPAHRYTATGLSLLDDDCWKRRYDLALSLHTDAAEGAALAGDYELMESHASAVMEHAQTLLDKVGIFEVRIMSFMAQNKPREAVDTAMEALELFGIAFPRRPGKGRFLLEFIRIKKLLARNGPRKIMGRPAMTDPHMLAVMRILMKIFPAVFITYPELLGLMVFKQVQLSIRHGNAPESAYAYTVYGLILCGLPGVLCDIDTGYRFGKLGIDLLEKLDAKGYEANTHFMFNCFIRHWKEHTSNSLDPFMEGYKDSLETGDLATAGLCLFIHDYYSYACGTSLGVLERDMARNNQAIARLKQKTTLLWHGIARQTVLNLLGRSEDCVRLKGSAYDEDEMLPVHEKAGDRTAIANLYYNKAFLCFIFNRYDEAIENFRRIDGYVDAMTSTLGVSLYRFYDCLSLLSVYPSRSQEEKKRIMKRVGSHRRHLAKWARHAPMNYLHRQLLVEGMLQHCLGREEKADRFLCRSMELAAQNGYYQERAYACELAARVSLTLGDGDTAGKRLRESLRGYDEWGASAKVRQLKEEFALLNDSPGAGEHVRTDLSRLDYSSVVHSLQAISTEILLDELLKKLLSIAIENAGADRAVLLSVRGTGVIIEAEQGPAPDSDPVVSDSPLEGRTDLLIPAINYVRQTGKYLVLDDACRQGPFTSDPYVLTAGPKSILCMPVARQSDPIAILYLENTLVSHAFTQSRIEVLSLLTSQAAISIENARLYEKSNRLMEMWRIFTSISSSFISLPLEEIRHELDNTLAVLGNFVKEDRCYLFLMSGDGLYVNETNEWCAPGIRSHMDKFQRLKMEDFPWVRNKLENFEIVHVPRVEDLPPESGNLKSLLKKRNIQSFVAVPMIHGGRLIGFIGFEAVRQEKTWDSNYIRLLRTVAEILANACARKRDEEDLRSYQEKLRSLSSELLLAEERQRRRIATDIHDRIGHALAVTSMKLRGLKEKASSPDTLEAVHVITDLIDQLIRDTQTLTFSLSPPVLYDLGLEAATDWLAEETRNQHGLNVSFSSDLEDRYIDNTTRVLVFQAIRELLFNVVKHAGAGLARIRITCRGDELVTVIEDDGCGFEPADTVSRGAKKGGYGLFSIRERLTSLGGSLLVESAPGRGTKITMISPMTQEKEA